MSVEIKGFAETIIAPNGTYLLSTYMLRLYDNFNQEVFDREVYNLPYFRDFVNAVYDIHNQDRPKYICVDDWMISPLVDGVNNTKDVVVAFSGGLDSCYLAILLKESGYNVHLLHVRNINGYEGNLSYVASKAFAQEMGFDYIECVFKRKGGKDNKYAQFWKDNTSKNQLITTLMIDICVQNKWNIVALGDDRSMSADRADMTLGINSTDCREVQGAYESCIKNILPDLKFMLIERDINSKDANKHDRLLALFNHGVIDSYYSCVGAGRFNQYNHRENERKFNIRLPKYNCGCSCAKCALHNLLLHYGGSINYPKDFIDKCWERLWNTAHGTIEALFAPDIPLDERIDNLFRY